jgi:hypothetical protein
LVTVGVKPSSIVSLAIRSHLLMVKGLALAMLMLMLSQMHPLLQCLLLCCLPQLGLPLLVPWLPASQFSMSTWWVHWQQA